MESKLHDMIEWIMNIEEAQCEQIDNVLAIIESEKNENNTNC